MPRNFVINIVFLWCNNKHVGNDAETNNGMPFLIHFDVQNVSIIRGSLIRSLTNFR